MRQDVLDYIQSLNLGTYMFSNELPLSESGTPLYIKNLKKIYVDVDQHISEEHITTLNGVYITKDTVIVNVYFANDAKSIPANYDDVVSQIRDAKNILPTTGGFSSRQVNVSTSLEADRLVTEFELRFIKIT